MKRTIRTIVAVLLAAALTLALTACGGNGEDLTITGGFDANIVGGGNAGNPGGFGENNPPPGGDWNPPAATTAAGNPDNTPATTTEAGNNPDNPGNPSGQPGDTISDSGRTIGDLVPTGNFEEYFCTIFGRNVIESIEVVKFVGYCQETGHPQFEDHHAISFGRAGVDDGQTLFSLGTRVIGSRDRHGHGDMTALIGGPFQGRRAISSGRAVFTVATEMVQLPGRRDKVQVHFNIAIYAPEGAWINGHAGSWNLRENHTGNVSRGDTVFSSPGHCLQTWLQAEAAWGAPDPAFWVGYQAEPGEVIDLRELHRQFRAAGDYFTHNPSFSSPSTLG